MDHNDHKPRRWRMVVQINLLQMTQSLKESSMLKAQRILRALWISSTSRSEKMFQERIQCHNSMKLTCQMKRKCLTRSRLRHCLHACHRQPMLSNHSHRSLWSWCVKRHRTYLLSASTDFIAGILVDIKYYMLYQQFHIAHFPVLITFLDNGKHHIPTKGSWLMSRKNWKYKCWMEIECKSCF